MLLSPATADFAADAAAKGLILPVDALETEEAGKELASEEGVSE
jgi:hypothetical protein